MLQYTSLDYNYILGYWGGPVVAGQVVWLGVGTEWLERAEHQSSTTLARRPTLDIQSAAVEGLCWHPGTHYWCAQPSALSSRNFELYGQPVGNVGWAPARCRPRPVRRQHTARTRQNQMLSRHQVLHANIIIMILSVITSHLPECCVTLYS